MRNRLLLCFFMVLGCGPAQALTNQLENHPSPYLALHGNDPVAWQDWSPAAVELAREQEKLLYISVGYFSCHWCHVMQKESYRDEVIAAILNESFIPVKVDRELEPALDARLIRFAQATLGSAGWPLNVFLTPQGHPLYSVLYMPPENFGQVLLRLRQLWQENPASLSELAARESSPALGPGKPELDMDRVRKLARSVLSAAMAIADKVHGGFGQSNKFPMAPQLDFLLDQYARGGNDELKEFLVLTLDRMAENGMYDHIGDGFFRYTTDPAWSAPHFEKMLYDNAQLAVLYMRASELLGVPGYEEIGRRTLDFMLREMRDEGGAMVASFSAVDGRGVEGGYYLWQKTELSELLPDEVMRVGQLAWGMDGPLAFQAGYLPRKGLDLNQISGKLNAPETEVIDLLESARTTLFEARSLRVLPTDSKLLAGWNGLALAGFAQAAKTTGSRVYLDAASGIHSYLMNRLWDGTSFRRAVDGTRALGQASLEDYAYAALGMWAWAELTQREEDFAVVEAIIEQAWDRFYDNGWRLAEVSLIASEPVRDLIADGPMPSPAAVVARLSLDIAARNGDTELTRRVLAALNSAVEPLERHGFWYTSQVMAMLEAVDPT